MTAINGGSINSTRTCTSKSNQSNRGNSSGYNCIADIVNIEMLTAVTIPWLPSMVVISPMPIPVLVIEITSPMPAPYYDYQW